MPRMIQANAVNSSARNRFPPEAEIMMSPKTTPMPVRETIATTIPAQAHPETMETAFKPASFKLPGMSFSENRFFLSNSMTTGIAAVAIKAE